MQLFKNQSTNYLGDQEVIIDVDRWQASEACYWR